MVTEKIQELNTLKAKLAALEVEVAVELDTELAALPARYGFESVDAFVKAVTQAGGKPRKTAKKAAVPTKRGKRGKVTDETRAEVKKMVAAEKTGAEIAKALGISVPTVQNIKKQLGLVKARG